MLAKLKEICSSATPGPWEVKEDSCNGKEEAWSFWHKVGPFELAGKTMDENSTFIATFNPATIAKILAVVEAAKNLYPATTHWVQGEWDDLQEALNAMENLK